MSSCGRAVLSQCSGDRGFCGCRNYPSRQHLEREIQILETLLQELRIQLDTIPELVDNDTDESDDEIENVDPSTTTQ